MKQTNICFLKYSAKDHMQTIRQAYNQGKNIKKETPEAITFSQALDDIGYFQFVIENGYSGYGDWGKDRFDKAFAEMKKELTHEFSANTSTLIPLPVFLDFIKNISLLFSTDIWLSQQTIMESVFTNRLKLLLVAFLLKNIQVA